MPTQAVDSQMGRSTGPKIQFDPCYKPVVVGLYGIQGCGKTTLLNKLKKVLGEERFSFYDSSAMIAQVAGSLEKFKELDESEKFLCRQRAIDKIRENSVESRKVAIVASHLLLWNEKEKGEIPVYTQNDFQTYTHILYLDVLASTISKQRLNDKERTDRECILVADLDKWQEAEKVKLRSICISNHILFLLISPSEKLVSQVSALLNDFEYHNEKYNLIRAENRLDEILLAGQDQLETVLVFDADKTLTAMDTGMVFWGKESENVLSTIFRSSLEYSYTAFRQATLMYEQKAEGFDNSCQVVASKVIIHPEFLSLLKQAAQQKHVRAMIVTCGVRRIWEKVLENEGLSHAVKVIGGGRIDDGFVVTASVKGALVARLRDVHGMYVWAFGDSVLDLDMMKKADRAIVVVGEERRRSKSMDAALKKAIDNEGLRAQQTLVPGNAPPRLDISKLPVVELKNQEFINSIFCHRASAKQTLSTSAKLLMTPMRNPQFAGSALREAHRLVGWYLAIDKVANLIGIEEYKMQHVQGENTTGYRLRNEKKTSIVALMRGGEPMAFGVSDAFPLAMFVHAGAPGDLKLHHLQKQQTVVLVDSVVNSGKTIVEFVEHIRNLHATIRIVVVSGVVQAQCIAKGGILAQLFALDDKIRLVALRQSENKYTGTGTVDTGNRLFNTVHLA